MGTNSIAESGWQTARRALVRGCLIPAGVLVLMIAGCGTLARYTSFDLGILTIPFKQNPGRFERKRLEGLVAKIRSLGVKSDEETRTFEWNMDTDVLSPCPDSARDSVFYKPYISALQTPSGKLKVIFVTRNLGHAGSYGFAYSDEPWVPKPNYWYHGIYDLDVPFHVNMTEPHMKIDDHWWKAYNNLD